MSLLKFFISGFFACISIAQCMEQAQTTDISYLFGSAFYAKGTMYRLKSSYRDDLNKSLISLSSVIHIIKHCSSATHCLPEAENLSQDMQNYSTYLINDRNALYDQHNEKANFEERYQQLSNKLKSFDIILNK